MTASFDRFAGGFIGQCLGDALGFPVEGGPPELCAAYVQQRVRPYFAGADVEFLEREGFTFGQYTDDSQLARELLTSWVAREAFDPADYARRIALMFGNERVVGRGLATTSAAFAILAGVHWSESGLPPPVAGNGSAMRAGPVGLMCHGDTTGLVQVAVDQGIITHQDPRCRAGTVAVAATVAAALGDGPLGVTATIEEVMALTHDIDDGFATSVSRLPRWLTMSPDEAASEIAVEGVEEPTGWAGISPFVVSSVLWSLYSFLRSPNDYAEVIATAIAVGGDVDTTAAMAGAMAGARVGLDALPPFKERLHDLDEWAYNDLVALAGLAHRVANGESLIRGQS